MSTNRLIVRAVWLPLSLSREEREREGRLNVSRWIILYTVKWWYEKRRRPCITQTGRPSAPLGLPPKETSQQLPFLFQGGGDFKNEEAVNFKRKKRKTISARHMPQSVLLQRASLIKIIRRRVREQTQLTIVDLCLSLSFIGPYSKRVAKKKKRKKKKGELIISRD